MDYQLLFNLTEGVAAFLGGWTAPVIPEPPVEETPV